MSTIEHKIQSFYNLVKNIKMSTVNVHNDFFDFE